MNITFYLQDMKKGGERGKRCYDTNNQPKRATSKYEQEGQFCLGVAKDGVQTKMSPTISFSGMYRKIFIYRSNSTNYQ